MHLMILSLTIWASFLSQQFPSELSSNSLFNNFDEIRITPPETKHTDYLFLYRCVHFLLQE